MKKHQNANWSTLSGKLNIGRARALFNLTLRQGIWSNIIRVINATLSGKRRIHQRKGWCVPTCPWTTFQFLEDVKQE